MWHFCNMLCRDSYKNAIPCQHCLLLDDYCIILKVIMSSDICNEKDLRTMPSDICTLHPDTPQWLTKDYIEKCLKAYYKDKQLAVIKWQTTSAVNKGDNYCGILLRIKIEFLLNQSKLSKSYMLKMPYQNDDTFQRIIGPFNVFNCEMNIYEFIIPKIKILLKEINDDENIFAETLMVDRERSVLIFEDLTERDFFMPDRFKGLNMDLIKLLLRKLAKFHAATAVLNDRNQVSMKQFNRGIFNRSISSFEPTFLACYDAFCHYISETLELCHLTEKLHKLNFMYVELLKRVFDPTPEYFNSLIHGDLWITNTLVKYQERNSGTPIDMVLIDYQFSAWGSPAIDLWYLFNTSLCEDLHINKQEELIKYYYEILRETLEKLKYQKSIPSLHKFHMQLHDKSFYRFHCTCIIQPIQNNVHSEDTNFHILTDVNENGMRAKRLAYTNPYCQGIIRQLLPLYDHLGLLDVDQ